MISTMPDWAKGVKLGDYLTVQQEFLTRGGEQGEVVLVNEEGAGIDFFCDVNGNPKGLPSIEFWEWGEIIPVR